MSASLDQTVRVWDISGEGLRGWGWGGAGRGGVGQGAGGGGAVGSHGPPAPPLLQREVLYGGHILTLHSQKPGEEDMERNVRYYP